MANPAYTGAGIKRVKRSARSKNSRLHTNAAIAPTTQVSASSTSGVATRPHAGASLTNWPNMALNVVASNSRALNTMGRPPAALIACISASAINVTKTPLLKYAAGKLT